MLSSHFTPGGHTLGIHTPLLQTCSQTTVPVHNPPSHEHNLHIPLHTLPVQLTLYLLAEFNPASHERNFIALQYHGLSDVGTENKCMVCFQPGSLGGRGRAPAIQCVVEAACRPSHMPVT